MAEAIVSQMREAMQPRLVEAQTTLDPLRPYTSEQAGEYLGLSANRVYEIPESELPRLRNGNRVRILGINLLLYALGQPPIDTEALAMSVRDRFLQDHSDPPRPVRRLPADTSSGCSVSAAPNRTRVRVH